MELSDILQWRFAPVWFFKCFRWRETQQSRWIPLLPEDCDVTRVSNHPPRKHLMNFPFYGGGNHWAIKTDYWSRSGFFCDDGGPTHADVDTLHQIWFKRKSSGNR